MGRRTMLRLIGFLVLGLLAGNAFVGGLTIGQPIPVPPQPEPTPPPQPVCPCILLPPLPPEIDDGLRARIPIPPPEPEPWMAVYEGKHFKTFINPEFQGINALLKFNELRQGAYIGRLEAAVPFRFEFKGGEGCPPPPVDAARPLDSGTYFLWMAHGGVFLGPRNRLPLVGGGTIELNWFVALVTIKIPFEPAIAAIIFYPDTEPEPYPIEPGPSPTGIIFYSEAKYRSPETMLKAVRSLDDGGILVPLPRETY